MLASAVDHRLDASSSPACRKPIVFCLDNDIALIPSLVNYLKENLAHMRLLDRTGLIRITVALREALMNAIVHGNLGVSSDLRDDNLDAYYKMMADRRQQSPYRERPVHVHAWETASEVKYVIRDEGLGFNPQESPTDAAGQHGKSERPRFAADQHVHGQGDAQCLWQ